MFGLQGAAIQEGIAKGLDQAGSSLLQAGMFKKQLDQQQGQFDKNLALQEERMAIMAGTQGSRAARMGGVPMGLPPVRGVPRPSGGHPISGVSAPTVPTATVSPVNPTSFGADWLG